MYTYTGHPLVDVGIAALVAHSRLHDPADLTPDHLFTSAKYLAYLYIEHPTMRRFARGTVFHNALYTLGSNALEQETYVRRVLYSWRENADTLPEPCAFCSRPAAYLASRRDIPMLNGEGMINFYPRGRAGLPVCGRCSLAMHMLPLGCIRVSGALLAMHTEDTMMMQRMAGTALRDTERALALTGLEKLPGGRYERTRLVETLLTATMQMARHNPSPSSLTAWVFTNSGTAPSVRLYQLSSSVVQFLRAATRHADGTLVDAWNRAVARAWQVSAKDKDDNPPQDQNANRLYEALLDLPQNAPMLLRRHLMPIGHWGLAALFVRIIMHISPERIDLLRVLGDRFARYAADKRAFFFAFTRTDNYSKWRRLLLRAADDSVRGRGQSLITMDEFITAFTAPPGEWNDWRLARDLIALRMMELLGANAEDSDLFEDDTEVMDDTDDFQITQED